MSTLLPFIVIGVATGAAYGLAGVGLVLTYKTSGIFNFAYGSVSAIAVFFFYWLHTQHGIPWPLTALIVLGVISPLEGLLLELMARTLEGATATLKVVATVGLVLIVLGIGTIWYGDSFATFPQFLPSSTIFVGGVYVSWSQIIVVVISLVATGVLYWFLKHARLGIAMRGVVDNPNLLGMTGESPVSVRRWAWLIGTVFASAAGLLLAPSLSLNALVITMLVVQAFGAAAIGYFSSLPLTFVGGLVLGICGALATKYVASVSWLTGLPAGLPFIVLFLVLIVTPKTRLMERQAVAAREVQRSWYAPARVRLLIGGVVTVLLLFVPQLVGTDLAVWSQFLIGIILFLSLGLLVRTSGQVSLCHLAFAAVGAAAFSHLSVDWHVPWLAAVLLAGIFTIPIGAVIAIPAIRLSGVFLALATLGFGIFLEQMIYTTHLMFGPTTSGIPAPRPNVSIAGWDMATDKGFYYVLLLFALATTAIVLLIERGRLGRLLRGLSDSPLALETQGANANVTRVLLFCISASLAGVSGALTSVLFHFAVGTNFASFNSLQLVVLVVIIVAGVPWYAIIAAAGYMIIPGYITVNNINNYLEIAFGVFAASYALSSRHSVSFPVPLRKLALRLDLLLGAKHRTPAPTVAGPSASDGRPGTERVRDTSALELEAQKVEVRFGGVRAVVGVTLKAEPSCITGLIGPNGAGKTTMFNVCSGLVKPVSGRVLLGGVDVGRAGLASRAHRGLGRTYQRPELFDSLNVDENVALGREAWMAGANPVWQLMSRPGEKQRIAHAAESAMEFAGVSSLAKVQVGLLPTGQRRLVELARALAGPFDMLLLDEPSAGLDEAETERFGEILRRIVAERNTGILLVEHDIGLVRRVCDYIYVLDFGQLIFEGPPDEMSSNEAVRSAYLGGAAEQSR